MAQTINEYPDIAVDADQYVVHQAGTDTTGLWGRWKVSALLSWLKANPQSLLDKTSGDGLYAPLAHVGAGGGAHADVIAGGADGFMTGADKSKLNGVASGATNNTGALANLDTVSATEINANAVGVAKMAQEGLDGQVLTSGGAGVDPSYQGFVVVDEFTANATGTINVGNLCYFNGTWNLAQANVLGTVKGLLGIAKSSVTNGQSLVCVLNGHITTSGRTIGAIEYVSPGTPGAYTETLPTGATYTRIVGYALSATLFRFRPSDDYILGTA